MLCVDVGATLTKAALISADGSLSAAILKRRTKPPLAPSELIDSIEELAARLALTAHVVVGFPGVVEDGIVLSPDNLAVTDGPGSATDESVKLEWARFPLAEVLSQRLDRVVVVANDADLAALGCASGEGLELTVTLGTGVGTGLVKDGTLQPHRELSSLSCFGDRSPDEMMGEQARKSLPHEVWEDRALAMFRELLERTRCDRCFVAGGNARRLSRDRLREFDDRVWIVAEPVGLLGGIRLLDQ